MAIYHIVPLCLITHEPQGASRPEHARCESPAGGASLLVLGPCQTGAASLATRKNLPSSSPLPPPKTKNRGGFGKIIDLGTIGYADSKKKRHDKQQNKSICCLSCHSKGPSELFETQVSFPSPLFCHERSLFWFSRLFGCFELLLPLLMSGPCYAQGIQGVVQRAGADAAGLS